MVYIVFKILDMQCEMSEVHMFLLGPSTFSWNGHLHNVAIPTPVDGLTTPHELKTQPTSDHGTCILFVYDPSGFRTFTISPFLIP